ncbi:hypothetical protein E2562_033659 [Oryza meyeriana var. granulata]|uniref:Uncharacterized protein n=1 Tax=Oryza meyeriana var. granulata TaxID=110450 RepID=A0A6G1C9E3_9ORYZ|nr:hypothetical protein E2562_033659 [Oryza meyeriana var. granulata]
MQRRMQRGPYRCATLRRLRPLRLPPLASPRPPSAACIPSGRRRLLPLGRRRLLPLGRRGRP